MQTKCSSCDQTLNCCLRPYSAAQLVNSNQTNPCIPHHHPSELVLAARRRNRICVSALVFSSASPTKRCGGGATDHLAWGATQGFCLLHGSVLSMSWSAAAAAALRESFVCWAQRIKTTLSAFTSFFYLGLCICVCNCEPNSLKISWDYDYSFRPMFNMFHVQCELKNIMHHQMKV